MGPRILNGALPPGAPINQDARAPELGVSVTPVREAMRRLEAVGLVQFEAHKTAILPLSRAELADIYDIREQLDPYAAAAATARVDDAGLAELYRLARIEPSSDPATQVVINRGFYRAVYARAGNAMLTDISRPPLAAH